MKLFKSKKFIVIDKVLSGLVTVDLPPMVLEPYINGREIGYALTNHHIKVVITQDRSSDAIVVYFGRTYEFSMQGNVPQEEAYRAAEYFHPDLINDIVKYIASIIRSTPVRLGVAPDEYTEITMEVPDNG